MKIGSFVCRHSDRRALAFTLMEVVVAVAITGIAFVSLYAGIFYCFRITNLEREDLRATQVMLQQVEGIRLFNWQQVANTNLNPTTFYARYFPGSGSVPPSGLIYTGTVVLAPVTLDPPTTYEAQMKELTVTLQWRSENLMRTRSIKTYVAKDGIQNYVYTY